MRWSSTLTPLVTDLWDVSSGNEVTSIPYALSDHDEGYRRSSAFSPDGMTLATIGEGGIQVVDLNNRHIKYHLPFPLRHGGALLFTPNNQWLVAVSDIAQGGQMLATMMIFDAQSGHLHDTISDITIINRYALYSTPDSRFLLFWSDNVLVMWDIQQHKRVKTFNRYSQVDETGSVIISTDSVQSVVFWYHPESATFDERYPFLSPCMPREHIAFIPHRDLAFAVIDTRDDLFTPSIYPTSCLWNMKDGHIIWQSEAQGSCISIAPNALIAAICGGNGVQLWHIPPT